MLGLNKLGQQQFDASVICGVLGGTAVAIRLFCKVRHKQGIKADDYWIVIALAFYWAADAVAIWGKLLACTLQRPLTSQYRQSHWRRGFGDEGTRQGNYETSREKT